VPADTAPCEACLAELYDPDDRRYRYALISCANCGPRFTIARGVPYERAHTTMAAFDMCRACRDEYEDPRSRRHQAQSIACPQCGPQVRLEGNLRDASNPVASAARLLLDGAILAVKGLGGYHLVVRADDPQPVSTLRARKLDQDRPFAVMVADTQDAQRIALVYEEEALLLAAPEHPIVLAPRRTGAPVADGVAPNTNQLGLMLGHTPLHHLLLSDFASLGGGALAIAGGNVGGEPLLYEDDHALARLADIADAFLLHDRPIHARAEDSVVQFVQSTPGPRRPMTLRRARGYVPDSLRLPVPARRSLLACGADRDNAFCLARGERAWVSNHIGDLDDHERLRQFGEDVDRFRELFEVEPELLAHDLQPGYHSTAYAMQHEQVELCGVQHHHAHLAAVLAEHGEVGPAVGAIYDGGGWGADGTCWGGELLVGGLEGFERVGHLRAVPLPGGDRAAREPWRMAYAWVAQASGDPAPSVPAALDGRVDANAWNGLARVMRSELQSPATSSVGLLLDAVAAFCGVRCNEVAYPGQAAAELQALADPGEPGAYTMHYAHGELDPRPAVVGALSDLEAGFPRRVVSARFHEALAAATVTACVDAAESAGLSLVVLAGDCFQNTLLLERVAAGVQGAGLRVLTSERLPPGDGSISFGQSAIAAVVSSL
jgi:hydrogenase maturation protein HypF